MSILGSITGVACIYSLSEVLSLLARLNVFMQRKTSDFSKLPIMLSSIVGRLMSLKEPGTDWCIAVDKAISELEKEHGITIKITIGVTQNNFAAKSSSEFQTKVVIPYIDALTSNINHRFSDEAVKLVVSASFFNPSLLKMRILFQSIYVDHPTALGDYYGKEAEVEFEGTKYCSLPIIDKVSLLGECQVFYSSIFPETFKMINILLSLPISTASVERSFSQMKMIKTRLRNRLSDATLVQLMKNSY